MVPTLRVIYRGIHISIHLGFALMISTLAPVLYGKHWYRKKSGRQIISWWTKRTSIILGLNIIQEGQPSESNSLIAANHVSFLDIIVIASLSPATFLSKSTLRFWPIIGFAAKRSGTIFIQRGSKTTIHRITGTICHALEQQRSIVIFPEGTTTLGNTVKKFHSGLFQSAVNTGTPVQPVALRYIKNGKPDRTAAYIDKDNFIVSLIKIMAQANTEVQITYCRLLKPHSMDRAELANKSHQLISQQLGFKT